MFVEGSIVAGKFRIDRVLGHGGMGVVVAATHLGLGQRVAMKFLLPELGSDAAIVGRFIREARASAQLRGEHACHVSDVGTLDNGAPYIVMELLDGRDLASVLAASGPLPAAMVADYMVQACLGLAEAHAMQIVHRDLKPANLFLTQRPDGTPLIKLVDFGIAKAPTDANFQLTRTATVMGSPGYMSPEQLRSSRDADVRSDIWALGVILYELTTGRQPFTAESITELALRVAMDPTPVLVGGNIPRGFERVVQRCLEKDPARRFQDVAQLASALAPFGGPGTRDRALGVARVLAASPGPRASGPSPVVTPVPTTLGGSAASVERPRGGGLRWGILTGVLGVVAIATIASVELRGTDQGAAVGMPATTTPGIDAAAVAASPPRRDAAPVDATPVDAGLAIDAGPAADAARSATPPAIDAGMPGDATVRGVVPLRNAPRPRPPTPGSDDDLGGSRR